MLMETDAKALDEALRDLGIEKKNEAGLSITGPLAEVRAVATKDATRRRLYEQQQYPYKGFYAVVVRAQRDQDAADGFRRENVSAYWPNYVRQRPMGRHAGIRRHRVILSPLFPGLIFCPTADADLFWAAIQRIPYVVNMLRKDGGVPAVLSIADIELVRHIESDANGPPAMRPVHNFKIGQKIRFVDDKLSIWPPGEIIRLDADGRISTQVYLMMRAVPIHGILPHQIEAIS